MLVMATAGVPAPNHLRGATYGLLAAALFGLSAPLAKYLLGEVTPQLLAGLLYLGAGLGLSVWHRVRPAVVEAPLQRRDLPLLAAVIVAGGILGPLLLLWGLNRVSAIAGSLLLNLEGPLTILVALLFFREHLGRWGVLAATFILLGAGLLKLEGTDGSTDIAGVLAIALACLAWALDNNLTQRLSLRDPIAIVRVKTLVAGSFNLSAGLLLGGRLPPWPSAARPCCWDWQATASPSSSTPTRYAWWAPLGRPRILPRRHLWAASSLRSC
jgi:drug/metabolite transporter (DMT)-like permease